MFFGSLEFVATADRKLLCVSIPTSSPSPVQAPVPVATRPWWLEDMDDALNFAAVGDGVRQLLDESLLDPIAAAVVVANEAMHAV